MVVYIHKGLFFAHVTCPSPLSFNSAPNLRFRTQVKVAALSGICWSHGKGEEQGETHVKTLKASTSKWHMSIALIVYLPKQDTQLSLRSVGRGIEYSSSEGPFSERH